MKVLQKIVCLTLLCGIAAEVRAQNPGDCLQWCLYDDGTNAMFFASHYEDQTGCTESPTDVYVTVSSIPSLPPAPEECPNCIPRSLKVGEKNLKGREQAKVAKVECFPLKNPLPINHKFKLKVPSKAKTKDGKEWSPLNGHRVLMSKWVYVQAADSEIPVKLYVVELDFRKTGLPEDYWKGKSPVRVVQVGFEMVAMPGHEKSPPTLEPTQVTQDCVYKAAVSLDSETGEFIVITKSAMFSSE